MKHTVPHKLGREKARKVADSAFESYKSRFTDYKPTSRWVTDDRAEIAFNVKGVTLSGNVEVKEDTFEMELDVPFMLRPFKGKALSVIEGEIRKWIGKAESGEV